MTETQALDERVSAFTEAAGSAATTVVEVPDVTALGPVLVDLAGEHPLVLVRDLAAGPVGAAVTRAGGAVRVPTEDDPVTAFADAPVGVVRGALAVAETGSVLVAEHALTDRLVSMLCRHLVQVVDRETVVDGLDEVARFLSDRGGQAGFASLVTGPSRSADIERSLTIGVQGPDRVTVTVVG